MSRSCRIIAGQSTLTFYERDSIFVAKAKFKSLLDKIPYDTIRYDTIEEFNVDSKAEYTA